MKIDFNNLPVSARGQARNEFIKANKDKMSRIELAEATGCSLENIRYHLKKINKGIDNGGIRKRKDRSELRGYASWECHQSKKYLSDNFGGNF
jgi:transcriptional antiterminator